MTALWENPLFREISGRALRPGGTRVSQRAIDWLNERGWLSEGSLAVDLGCGAGVSVKMLTDLRYTAVGLDRDRSLLTTSPQGLCLCADLTHPPLKAGIFDLVLLECVLSLLTEPAEGLVAARTLLGAGGVCVVSDLTGALSATGPCQSCAAGARTKAAWEALFHQTGFRLLHTESHTHALAELCARLLWYGTEELCGLVPRTGGGYQLWILAKA